MGQDMSHKDEDELIGVHKEEPIIEDLQELGKTKMAAFSSGYDKEDVVKALSYMSKKSETYHPSKA